MLSVFFSDSFYLRNSRNVFAPFEGFILRKSDPCTPRSLLPEESSALDPEEHPFSEVYPRSDKATPPSRLSLSQKRPRISKIVIIRN